MMRCINCAWRCRRFPEFNCFELSRAACRVAPWKSRGEIWFVSLLWMQFCLENGSLHKRTTLIGLRVFKMAVSIGGCHLHLKEQFSLAEGSAFFVEPFASSLMLETPQRYLWGRPWLQIGLKIIAELNQSWLWGIPWTRPRSGLKHASSSVNENWTCYLTSLTWWTWTRWLMYLFIYIFFFNTMQ